MKKNVLLGITGGIAAYKMVEVASRLTRLGHSVHVVMTEGGTKFVTPLTFQNITHNPVETKLFTPPVHYGVKHISLADRADVCLVGPATANFIGKIAGGIADDLLSTIIMAIRTPVLIAPSMNVNMYNNPIFQDNLTYLRDKGYKIIEPTSGSLACGDEGKGRLPEPVELVEHIVSEFTPKILTDKKVLVTAGPTREYLDPIRYFTNSSSGKMGYALARAARDRGADVTLISGKVSITPPSGIKTIYSTSALEMESAVKEYFTQQDIVVMAAAVADFRPVIYSNDKIKKDSFNDLSIRLDRNPDILSGLVKIKNERQILVGFAAESTDLLNNAMNKLKKKKLDMIIANKTSAFGSDNNQVMVITPTGQEKLSQMDKAILAGKIMDKIAEHFINGQ